VTQNTKSASGLEYYQICDRAYIGRAASLAGKQCRERGIERKHMLQESDGDRKCSFCQKNCSEAAYLFAGVDGSICSECVLVCLEILKDEKIVPKGVAPDYKMSSIPAASA